MPQAAKLEVNGKSIDLEITVGTEDEIGMDVSKLRSETGAITLDYGYANTGATESAITFIDGEKGILRYRGYPIEQLAEDSSFAEVSYLAGRASGVTLGHLTVRVGVAGSSRIFAGGADSGTTGPPR